LDAAKVLREAGAIVEACFAITNFDMPETMRNFEKHHITAYQLLPFAFIVEKAEKLGANLIEKMEQEGVVSKPNSMGKRRVLVGSGPSMD